MRSAHQWWKNPCHLPVNAPARVHAWREWLPLSPLPHHGPVVLSHREPLPPSPSPKAGTFPLYFSRFTQTGLVWPLAACPVRSAGRSSWIYRRPKGGAHFSATPWNTWQSAAVPHSPTRNVGASVGGWRSLSHLSLPLLRFAPPLPSLYCWWCPGIGRSWYNSRLAAIGGQASGYFVRSTYITLSLVFVHCSAGCVTPPPPSPWSTPPPFVASFGEPGCERSEPYDPHTLPCRRQLGTVRMCALCLPQPSHGG